MVQVRSVWLVSRLRQCPWSRYTTKIAQFRSVAPPTKRARGGRVTAPVTARAGAVFDGSEPFASGTRAHDQKVASYEPVAPIYEVVKTALVACPIKVAVSDFRWEKRGILEFNIGFPPYSLEAPY